MPRFLMLLFLLLLIPVAETGFSDERPRLLVLTDIGGDPDDQQSLVRLMMYSNEFQIEGIIASASGTPGEIKQPITRVDLIQEIVSAYGQVRRNLVHHAAGWPKVDSLQQVIKSGNPHRGREHIGKGHNTEGSNHIIKCVDAGSEKHPLNIAIWGGQTDFAQALWQVRHERGQSGLVAFVGRFRVYDIADQDGLAGWLRTEFPGMFYILSKAKAGSDKRQAAFRGMYLTGDESLTSQAWIATHITSASPLGRLYPTKTWSAPNPHKCMKEGDTPSWFFFLPHGGNNVMDPTQPGWGGQFYLADDGWYRDDRPGMAARQSVSRWRAEFQEDFALRMSWTRQ